MEDLLRKLLMKPILIFALSSRCGSTAIMEAIASSANLEWLGEPFHKDWDNWSSINIENKPHFSIENICKQCNGLNISVVKTIESHLTTEYNLELIKKFKTVFLYRKYFIDSALSEWTSWNYYEKFKKDAYYIDHIRSFEDFHIAVRDPIDIDYIHIKYKQELTQKEKYLDLCRFVDVITYEGYFNEDIINNHNKLMNTLETDIRSDNHLQKIDPSKKHNSHSIYRKIIPNYDEVMKLRDELIL